MQMGGAILGSLFPYLVSSFGASDSRPFLRGNQNVRCKGKGSGFSTLARKQQTDGRHTDHLDRVGACMLSAADETDTVSDRSSGRPCSDDCKDASLLTVGHVLMSMQFVHPAAISGTPLRAAPATPQLLGSAICSLSLTAYHLKYSLLQIDRDAWHAAKGGTNSNTAIPGMHDSAVWGMEALLTAVCCSDPTHGVLPAMSL